MDELKRCYELLGVRPGACVQELKTAHRDLAKVWRPDRFAHDPRLQQKAQEKLKEINEAYDLLMAAKEGRRAARVHAPAPQASAPAAAPRRRALWPLVLLAWSVSCSVFAVFFYAFRAPAPTAEQRPQPRVNQDEQKTERAASTANRPRARQSGQQKGPEATGANDDDAEVRALPTVTVTIDPTTGQLASPTCPVKTRMTYPAGAGPRQLCAAAHQQGAPATAPARPKESRLKSFGKRLKGIISSADN